MDYIGYIILGIIIIICISGNKEIIDKKYPKTILLFVDTLMVIQTFTVLGGNGKLDFQGDFSIFNIIAYCFGYFLTGLLSLIFLGIYISFYNKISGKKE